MRITTWIRKRWLGGLVVGTVLGGMVGSAQAADLRSQLGNRTVVRTASMEPNPVEAAPMVPKEDAPPMPQPEPAMGDAMPRHIAEAHDNWSTWNGYEDEICCPPLNWWGNVDYILWKRRGQSLPALVTTGPAVASDGVLGRAGTTILFGAGDVADDFRSGGRFEFGRWFDGCESFGAGARAFFLSQANSEFDRTSDQTPLIARPFINVSPSFNGGVPAEDSFLVTDPTTNPVTTGSISVRTTSDVLGGDAFFRWQVRNSPNRRFDVLLGYQFSRMDENITINSTSVDVATLTISDAFDVRNEFQGGMIGVRTQWYLPNTRFEFLTKIGMGNMHETVTITGSSVAGGVAGTSGGLLARTVNNIGRFERDEFVVVPELGVNCAFQLNDRWELTLGYSFIYWSSIVQAGTIIDRQVNLDPFPNAGPSRPTFTWDDNSYWVHGFNAGIQCRF